MSNNDRHRPAALPDAMLRKVRALLAKAESTSFDEEAEAFTAKAQELMTRFRIDRALIESAARDARNAPVARRIDVEAPYAGAKATLLARVAAANGCHTVFDGQNQVMTVFGFADELDAVEELFTSLLVQATVALQREGSKTDNRGRSRTRRFRHSFLVAFAVRIGQRLRETVEATVKAAAADSGAALVPVLAARAEATRAAAQAAFPHTVVRRASASDLDGWRAGTAFGDQVDLGGQARLPRPA